MKLKVSLSGRLLGSVLVFVALPARPAEPPSVAFPESTAETVEPQKSPSERPPAVVQQEVQPEAQVQAQPSVFLEPSAPAVAAGTVSRLSSAEDSDAVFRAFSVYVEQEQRERMVGSVGSMVLGGATMAIGSALANDANQSPTPWLIVGGVAVGTGALGLLLPGPAQRLADSHGAAVSGHTPSEARALEHAWLLLAQKARGQRKISGVIALILGAGGVGVGAALLTGVGDLTQNERELWGSIALGAGAGLVVAGVGGFVLRSPAEVAFDQYEAGKPSSKSGTARLFDFRLSAGLGGVDLAGRF